MASKRVEDGHLLVWKLLCTLLEKTASRINLSHVCDIFKSVDVLIPADNLVVQSVTLHRFIEKLNISYHCGEVLDALLDPHALCLELRETRHFVSFRLPG